MHWSRSNLPEATTSSSKNLAVLCLVVQLYLTFLDPMDCSLPGSSVHGDSLGKNTAVGCHALQGIFPMQGLNPGLPHCRWIVYRLSHQGSPPKLALDPKTVNQFIMTSWKRHLVRGDSRYNGPFQGESAVFLNLLGLRSYFFA